MKPDHPSHEAIGRMMEILEEEVAKLKTSFSILFYVGNWGSEIRIPVYEDNIIIVKRLAHNDAQTYTLADNLVFLIEQIAENWPDSRIAYEVEELRRHQGNWPFVEFML